MLVLLIEDDAKIAQDIAAFLSAEGIKCNITSRGEEALQVLRLQNHDIILLDLSLPGMTGFALIDTLRKSKVRIPIIVTSGITDTDDKIRALNLGADDYVTKPLVPQELLARIKRNVLRSQNQTNIEINSGDLKINLDTQLVTVGGNIICLTNKEYALLAVLARKQGILRLKEQIQFELYSSQGINIIDKKIVDVFVCRVRKKLKLYSKQKFIKTFWGRGYGLSTDEEVKSNINKEKIAISASA
ncbi:hypothetical protein AB836_01995 [Rickettsiales bacterium (ex Bugula neritina AB1)]|nr:hypothetical protein AB836_01995 [Rickettsiales bacterium (ex Bugula neritina AB1)]